MSCNTLDITETMVCQYMNVLTNWYQQYPNIQTVGIAVVAKPKALLVGLEERYPRKNVIRPTTNKVQSKGITFICDSFKYVVNIIWAAPLRMSCSNVFERLFLKIWNLKSKKYIFFSNIIWAKNWKHFSVFVAFHEGLWIKLITCYIEESFVNTPFGKGPP